MVVFTTAVAVGWKILEGGVCGAISAGVTYCGLKSCHPQQSPDGKQGAQKVDKQVDTLKICHYQSPDGKQGEQKHEKQIDTPAVEQREVFLAPAPVPDVALRDMQISEPHVQQDPPKWSPAEPVIVSPHKVKNEFHAAVHRTSPHAQRPAGTEKIKAINAPTSLGRKWKAPQHPSTYTVMRDLEEAERQAKALQELFRQPAPVVGQAQ